MAACSISLLHLTYFRSFLCNSNKWHSICVESNMKEDGNVHRRCARLLIGSLGRKDGSQRDGYAIEMRKLLEALSSWETWRKERKMLLEMLKISLMLRCFELMRLHSLVVWYEAIHWSLNFTVLLIKMRSREEKNAAFTVIDKAIHHQSIKSIELLFSALQTTKNAVNTLMTYSPAPTFKGIINFLRQSYKLYDALSPSSIRFHWYLRLAGRSRIRREERYFHLTSKPKKKTTSNNERAIKRKIYCMFITEEIWANVKDNAILTERKVEDKHVRRSV